MAKDTVSSAKKNTKPPNSPSSLHPPYFTMISEAILMLKDRTGSSQQAIAKFIEDKYKKLLPSNFKKVLSVQLKKFVKSERLVKVKNSFKISSAEKLKLAVKETQKKKGIKEKAEKIKTANPKIPKAKMKRLSQVKTPEGMKKKNLTPVKRKGLIIVNSLRAEKKAKK